MCRRNWDVRLKAFTIFTKINASTHSLAYDAFRSRACNITLQLHFCQADGKKAKLIWDWFAMCVCVRAEKVVIVMIVSPESKQVYLLGSRNGVRLSSQTIYMANAKCKHIFNKASTGVMALSSLSLHLSLSYYHSRF